MYLTILKKITNIVWNNKKHSTLSSLHVDSNSYSHGESKYYAKSHQESIWALAYFLTNLKHVHFPTFASAHSLLPRRHFDHGFYCEIYCATTNNFKNSFTLLPKVSRDEQAVPLSIHELQPITRAHICSGSAAFGWNLCTRRHYGSGPTAVVIATLNSCQGMLECRGTLPTGVWNHQQQQGPSRRPQRGQWAG